MFYKNSRIPDCGTRAWISFCLIGLLFFAVTACGKNPESNGAGKPDLTKKSISKKKKKKKKSAKKTSVTCWTSDCSEAEVALKKGKNKMAIYGFKNGLKSNPNCFKAYYGIARAQFNMGRARQALESLDKAIALEPKNIKAYTLHATINESQGNFSGVYLDTSKVIEINPNLAAPYVMRARAAYFNSFDATGDCSETPDIMGDLDKAIAIDPKLASAYEAKGVLLASRKKVREAISCFSLALKLAPRAELFQHRAAGYSYFEEFDLALQDLNAAIKLSPNDLNAHKAKAGIFKEIGHFDDAIKEYDKIAQIAPHDYINYSDRAKVYLTQKNYDKAIEDYSLIVKANPLDEDAYKHRGDVYFQKGDFEKALSDYDHAIQLYPNSIAVLEERVKVLRKLGRKKEADIEVGKIQSIKKLPAIKRL